MWTEVSAGYRLPAPIDCPPFAYDMMLACWHEVCDENVWLCLPVVCTIWGVGSRSVCYVFVTGDVTWHVR